MKLLDENKRNFTNLHNEYLGGGISPGIQMKFKALHQFTSKLPLIDFDKSFTDLVGVNTQQSILSGVLNGSVAEVDGIGTLVEEDKGVGGVVGGEDVDLVGGGAAEEVEVVGVGVGQGALPVESVVSEFTLVHGTVSPGIPAPTMHLPFCIFANIDVTVRIGVLALPIHFVVSHFTLVHVTASKGVPAPTMLLPFCEFPNIDVTVRIGALALPMQVAVSEISFLNLPVGPLPHACAVLLLVALAYKSVVHPGGGLAIRGTRTLQLHMR